jgi:hypothetical protein
MRLSRHKLIRWQAIPVVLAFSALLLVGSNSAHAQGGSRNFPETGKTVQGLFLDYWNTHGGLLQQGYPISDEMQEVSDTDGNSYTVQYFERAIFEYHPANDAPYNVLLSLLGNFEYEKRYPQGATDQQASTLNPRSFPETGKTIGGRFREYWEEHGGLAQQGYPLTDDFEEVSRLHGQTYMVQYFERAVFEYHPDNPAPYEVLLSQLGMFRYQVKYAAPDWSPKELGRLAPSSWSWDSSKLVAGDFNGDGKDEVAVLYKYPGDNTALFIYDLSQGELAPKKVWSSGEGKWSWDRSKLLVADVDGDGRDEVVVFYDLGDNNTSLVFFALNQPTIIPVNRWESGKGNWAWDRTLPVAGDFDGDGKDEIGAFYNYLDNTTGLFTFDFGSVPAKLNKVWVSGAGTWGWERTKPLTGDFNGDGSDEIAAFYNYPNDNTGLFTFDVSGGPVLQQRWESGEGVWSWDASWPVAADFNGDGKAEIAVLYQYPQARGALFIFDLSTVEPALKKVWEITNPWATLNTAKLVAGDLDGDRKASIVMMYKNAFDVTEFWQFK